MKKNISKEEEFINSHQKCTLKVGETYVTTYGKTMKEAKEKAKLAAANVLATPKAIKRTIEVKDRARKRGALANKNKTILNG